MKDYGVEPLDVYLFWRWTEEKGKQRRLTDFGVEDVWFQDEKEKKVLKDA